MITGVTVIDTQSNKIVTAVDVANVTMRNYSDQEIDDYIATGEPMDKGGAYGIQGLGANLVEKFEGDKETIMGISTKTVQELLNKVK